MQVVISWLRQNLAPVLFSLGLGLIVLLAGIVIGGARLFPYPILNAARDAAVDLKENWRHYLGIQSKYALATGRVKGGLVAYDQQLAFDGYTFVTAYGAGQTPGFNAYLLDMEGRVAHEWDATVDRIWPDGARVAGIGRAGSVDVQGAHLFDNGDVILDVGSLGSVKLDRCSRVLWTLDRPTHHHVEQLANGELLLPSSIQRTSRPPEQLFAAVGPSGFYEDHTILRTDAAGHPLDETSIIDILLRGGWASALISGQGPARHSPTRIRSTSTTSRS